MKIISVEIDNYRQFKRSRVEMSTDPKRNITVIQAANGVGKSNFMNAIIWCLYGDEIFISENEGRDVVNESALHELRAGERIEVRVAVVLGEGSPEYRFERSVTFLKTKSGHTKQPVEFIGFRIEPERGAVSVGNPEWQVESRFIPKDLRGFFFFDGERMNSYFEDTSRVKENVEKIARIDVLQDVENTLKAVEREIRKDVKEHSPDMEYDIDAPAQIEDNIEALEKEIEDYKHSEEEYENELEEIREYLMKNSDEVVAGIETNIKNLEEMRKGYFNDQHRIENDIAALVSDRFPILMALDAIARTSERIEQETVRGELPPKIKDVFLRDLLTEGTCICGRALDEGGDSRHRVETLLAEIVPSKLATEAVSGKYLLQDMIGKKDFMDDYRNLVSQRIELDFALRENKDKIDGESAKLSGYDVEVIREKSERREELKRLQRQCRTRLGVLGGKVMTLWDDHKHITSSIEKHREESDRAGRYQSQLDCAGDIRRTFTAIRRSIVDEIREELEEKTKEYFFNMIWKKGAFSDVQILDNRGRYRISVKSDVGGECLGDISAGERQVLAFAFTAALYGVSGYSVPIIIDTPLGRISEEPRAKIAAKLPQYLAGTQIIMLPTDTEYTESVRNEMSSRVGAEYIIQHDESTRTSEVVRNG